MVVMKKTLLYIALAVAATAFATSCVKELVDETTSTENTGKVEVTGQVFEGVMEDTKSVIEGNTPTWVEGDAISIFGSNQAEGLECTYLGENKFQSKESAVVEGPYYAIYPHKEGHTVNQETGVFTATVPSEQIITAGHNVGAGALVAVAASETTELYFRNAVGLVRLENKREDIVSIKIESTTSGQVIAGEFTMSLDGETATVTPVEGKGATSITLKPAEENGTLAAGEYYATLLPCSIDGLKVTFTRKNGEKTETATVTKTKETTIPRNGGANLGAFFAYEIKNAAELLAWNKAAAKWTAWDVVTLADDIDCAEEPKISSEWKVSDKIFEGTFDGNNKTIKNFVIKREGPAAFFGRVTNATITNLTFDETCSFTTTGTTGENPTGGYAKNRMYAASLVCDATARTTLRNITNYARVDATTTSASNGNYIGGICAYFDATVGATNCKNYGHISYSSASTASWVNVSGCFGHTTKDITLEGCENHGLVQFLGTNSGNKSLNLAGITGGANNTTFKNCKNNGKIECKATAKHTGGTNIGGFVGLINSNVTTAFENCENTSNGILINSCQSGGTVAIGGSIGYITGKTDTTSGFSSKVSISDFKNYGTIQNAASVSGTLSLGGIAGLVAIASENHISSCENHGEVKNSSTCSGNIYIGGIVGSLNNANTNISNVTNKGNITNQNIDASTINKIIAVGGIAGYAKGGSGNSITKATNSAAIKPCSAETDAFIYAGGIVGCIESGSTSIGDSTVNGVSNSGNISWGSKTYDSGVGGIVGKIIANSTNTIQNCKNTGNISHTSWLFEPIKNVHGWGGILGCHTIVDTETTVTLNVSSCTNEGKVTKTGGSVCHIHLGGITGSVGATNFNTSGSITNPKATEIFLPGNGTANIQSCTNKGAISNTWTTAGGYKYSYTGGIAGYFNYDGELLNCENLGAVSSSVASNGASHIALGGIVGRSAAGRITNCTNNALVTEGSTTAGGYVGGIVGRSESTRELTLTNCDNKQAISVNFSSNGDFRVGGIIGIAFKDITLDGCDNSGDITVNTTKTSGGQYLGGLIGQSENNLAAIIKNCSCKATLKPTTTLSLQYSGMIAGRITDKNNPAKSSVSNTTVAGTFNGTPLTSSNFTSYCFGSGSNFKVTTGITFAE